MISQIFPGLELPGGIPARAQRTGPGPDKYHLPTRPSRVLQAPPGLCPRRVSLWGLASRCPTCPQTGCRGARSPGGWEEFDSWLDSPSLSL